MFKELVALANHLDNMGLTTEADLVDRIMQEAVRVSTHAPPPPKVDLGPNVHALKEEPVKQRKFHGTEEKVVSYDSLSKTPPSLEGSFVSPGWESLRKSLWSACYRAMGVFNEFDQKAEELFPREPTGRTEVHEEESAMNVHSRDQYIGDAYKLFKSDITSFFEKMGTKKGQYSSQVLGFLTKLLGVVKGLRKLVEADKNKTRDMRGQDKESIKAEHIEKCKTLDAILNKLTDGKEPPLKEMNNLVSFVKRQETLDATQPPASSTQHPDVTEQPASQPAAKPEQKQGPSIPSYKLE